MDSQTKYFDYRDIISHIVNILEERIFLYKKRRLEIKRYLKSVHRSGILPKSHSVFLLIIAEIQYLLNRSTFFVLNNLLESISEGNHQVNDQLENEQVVAYEELFSLLINDEYFEEKIKEHLKTEDSEIKSVLLDEYSLKNFVKVVLSVDEEFQRKIIAKFAYQHSEELLSLILKKIAIFDIDFLRSTNEILHKHLSDFVN